MLSRVIKSLDSWSQASMGAYLLAKGFHALQRKQVFLAINSSRKNKVVIKLSPIRCQPYQESRRSETN